MHSAVPLDSPALSCEVILQNDGSLPEVAISAIQ